MNDPSKPDLLVEIGVEELPAGMVLPAVEGLRDGLLALLAGVERGAVRTYATPRRLAVAIVDLAHAQPSTEREITGPPAERAFGPDGQPTEVGVAFAVGKGARAEDLRVVELPKRGRVAAVTIREGGARVVDLLSAGLADLITKIPFPKKMIWGNGGLAFGRPLQRVLAIFGGQVIPGEVHGIPFGNVTVGHRLAPEPVTVGNEAFWLASLRAHYVEPDVAVRRARVEAMLEETARELGADPIRNDALLDEVVQLVEWPVRVLGTFDEDLLGLPPRLLVTSMRVHQRYFPVSKGGKLTNRFVVIGNNPLADPEVVAEGNARVLRARFYDARFFLREDQGKRLEAHGEKLGAMRWIRGLGTMADKALRLVRHGAAVSDVFGADAAAVARAGALCKCDLATQMVGEFPELQGHVGQLYARHQGEPDAVAVAIEEHYQPRFAGDALPAGPEARALAVAERLDALVGCFGIGMEPSGSGDPQGLRRAASGLVQIFSESGLRLDLRALFASAVASFHAACLDTLQAAAQAGHATGTVEQAAAAVPAFDAWFKARGVGEEARGAAELVEKLVTFTLARFKANQIERGRSTDVVEAALTGAERGAVDVVALGARLDALAAVAGTERFIAILTTVKRLLNITRDQSGEAPSAADCLEPAEQALLAATAAAAAEVSAAAERLDYGAALDAVIALAEPVEAFFVAVMVLDPDPVVRARRVGILLGVAAVFGAIADFSRISTR